MITLSGINDINMIPFSKNTLVYINKDLYLDNNDYLDSDLIGFKVYNNEIEKTVLDINYLNNNKKLLKTSDGYIPFELIENVDFKNKKIKIMEVSGL
jgi:ribosomal 30S subunit maturation factor RimM